jgi:hypothetical protein
VQRRLSQRLPTIMEQLLALQPEASAELQPGLGPFAAEASRGAAHLSDLAAVPELRNARSTTPNTLLTD